MEVTLAKEYSAIREDLLHYLGLMLDAGKRGVASKMTGDFLRNLSQYLSWNGVLNSSLYSPPLLLR